MEKKMWLEPEMSELNVTETKQGKPGVGQDAVLFDDIDITNPVNPNSAS